MRELQNLGIEKNVLVRIDIDNQTAYLGSTQKYSSNVKVKSEGKRFDIEFTLPMKNGPDSRLTLFFTICH